MVERSAERIPFNELPAERALELVRGWRAMAESNNPADTLESTDRFAAFVKLTSPEVTGQVRRLGYGLPGSWDPRVIDEILEGVRFVMHDGDTFDRQGSHSFQGSLQRVADVCVVSAVRNVIETGRDHGREEEIGELIAKLANEDGEFGWRGRAQQGVAWLLVSNVREGRYMEASVDGLAAVARRGHGLSGVPEAVTALTEVAIMSRDNECQTNAAEILEELERSSDASTRQLVRSAQEAFEPRAV
ncbi:MAG: hypothetical protein U1D32_01355 [Patescibacteria group bacterium]|nr:hypothetical protein [Patescibacteria group bacterium]